MSIHKNCIGWDDSNLEKLLKTASNKILIGKWYCVFG